MASKEEFFLKLVKEGNVESCKSFLVEEERKTTLVNTEDERGWTVLHHAADLGHSEIISWLLCEEGVGFTKILAQTTNDGKTALHLAASRGFVEACVAIVKGARQGEKEKLIFAVDFKNCTVLHCAVSRDSRVVSWLLLDDCEIPDKTRLVLARNSDQQTALHLAVDRGNLESCKLIVQACAEKDRREELLNAVDNRQRTIFHYAVTHFFHLGEILDWIQSEDVEDGARAQGFELYTAGDENGKTALHVAAEHGEVETCQRIIQGSKLENGERQQLLDVVDNDNQTILHLYAGIPSAYRTNWAIVSLLHDSQRKAKKEEERKLREKEGDSFTATAATTRFTKLLARDVQGRTALHLAIENSMQEACETILEACMDEGGQDAVEELLTAVDCKGLSVLHYAAKTDYSATIAWMMSILRQAGVLKTVIRQRSDEGKTALHVAAFYGHFMASQALVKGCEDDSFSLADDGREEKVFLLNAADNKGWTALHHAASSISEVLPWLISAEGGGGGGGRGQGFNKLMARNSDGLTAFHLAVQAGNGYFVQAFLDELSLEEEAEVLNAGVARIH